MTDREDYETFYQPVYFRQLDELTEPVQASGAPFRVERAETYKAPVPFNHDFVRTGDIDAYARDHTNFYRALRQASFYL